MTELIIAADVSDETRLTNLLAALSGQPVWIKLGLEALTAFGLGLVERVGAAGFKVFADTKLHDIPNTVGATSRVLAGSGADLFNVHCSGGRAMCEAARRESEAEAARLGRPRPLVAGVTVLTSLDAGDLKAIGVARTPGESALAMAGLAKEAGLDGVVCSVHEVEAVKSTLGTDFLTICPGIRPAGSAAGDQKRVATPALAARVGADFIVVGRPVTRAPDPAAACQALLAEMERP